MSFHITNFAHVDGAGKGATPLSGGMRASGSGEGLGSSENQSWNTQYRYMLTLADKIEYISRHLVDSLFDDFYAKQLLSNTVGLWHLFLGSPKANDVKEDEIKRINIRLKTAELYYFAGYIEKEVEILREIFLDILKPLRDGYTFKGSRAKVRIRSGIAGDIDELVGRK